ncbi:hypothetical protein HanRHA438_Chr01g0037521 [Helianthus annuus]|nr:hypothetical protein HanRHA438_Chr01g0037521 [Helianthus annuus]
MERVMGERCLVKMASYWAFEDGARCLYKTPRPYNQFLGITFSYQIQKAQL